MFIISWIIVGFVATIIERIYSGRKYTVGEYISYTCLGYLGFFMTFVDVIAPPLGKLIETIFSWEI